jgi:hypothetical protein
MWFEVGDFLRTKRCFEQKKTGRCGCRAQPKNACGIATAMAESADNMGLGRPANHTPDEIYKLVAWKRCGKSRRGRSCNHKACIRAERIVDWLATQTTQKAA